MNATTVAVDLARSVFQLAVADSSWHVVESHRLTRTQFERWFANRAVSLVIMEACGSAHHWARWLDSLGIEVRLLPAAYIRAYVRRNKTDAADARALLEAARAADIAPVRVKSIEQQALQGLHRIRSLWMSTRTSRINALRGFCREFGLTIPQGAWTGVEAITRVLADPRSPVPALIRETMQLLIEEIRLLEQRIAQLERELMELARHSAACTQLMSVPGIGLLTATAMVVATGGNVTHFKDARHFASRSLDGLRAWATEVQQRTNHNKAACALANKLARICYAVLRDHAAYGNPQPRPNKKLERTAFATAV